MREKDGSPSRDSPFLFILYFVAYLGVLVRMLLNGSDSGVVLTSFSDDNSLFPALKAGAVAYLLKDVSPKELAEAITAAARGETRLHPDVTKRLVAGIAGGAERGPGDLLTEREMDVLRSLARGKSNKEIGAELFISEKTVKTHMGSILDKLGLQDRTQAALYAVKHGMG